MSPILPPKEPCIIRERALYGLQKSPVSSVNEPYMASQVDGQMEEIAQDFNSNWMTAIDMIDDDTFLGAENYYNLFTVRKNSDAATEEVN